MRLLLSLVLAVALDGGREPTRPVIFCAGANQCDARIEADGGCYVRGRDGGWESEPSRFCAAMAPVLLEMQRLERERWLKQK